MLNRKILFVRALTVAVVSILAMTDCSCKPTDSTKETGESTGTVAKADTVVDILDTLNLKIYFPKYSDVRFVTEEMPSKNDTTVIMVAEAAFTAGNSEELAQGKIAGDHVTAGVREIGYKCKRNNGAFVYYNGEPKFVYHDYSGELDLAAKNGGSGFAQEMMIHNGREVPHTRPADNVNEFRALCLIDGQLAIADSKGNVAFGDFIADLLKSGATEALYLDMGPGWDYSWYRSPDGHPVDIHPESTVGTNWIAFYR